MVGATPIWRLIETVPLEAGLLERSIEQPTRRSDEGLALLVLLIAGLFAHDHEASIGGGRNDCDHGG